MHVLMLLQFHYVTLNTSSLWFALDFTYSLDASRAFFFSSAKSLSSWEGCLFTENIQVPPQSHAWARLDASSDTKPDFQLYRTGEQFSQLLWVKVLNRASKCCQRKCYHSHLHRSSQDKEGHCTPTSPSSSSCRVETWRPHKIFYCFSPACPHFDGL